MARRGKRAADSRGGGDIRSGIGGSKKQISWWCCCSLLENTESSGGGEKDGSANPAWPPGGIPEHHTCLGVWPTPTAQVWRRSGRMIRIRCLIRIAVGWKVLLERSEGKPTKNDEARGVKFGSTS